MRLRVSGPANSAATGFAKVEVSRVGTPTDPVAIPVEAVACHLRRASSLAASIAWFADRHAMGKSDVPGDKGL